MSRQDPPTVVHTVNLSHCRPRSLEVFQHQVDVMWPGYVSMRLDEKKKTKTLFSSLSLDGNLRAKKNLKELYFRIWWPPQPKRALTITNWIEIKLIWIRLFKDFLVFGQAAGFLQKHPFEGKFGLVYPTKLTSIRLHSGCFHCTSVPVIES